MHQRPRGCARRASARRRRVTRSTGASRSSKQRALRCGTRSRRRRRRTASPPRRRRSGGSCAPTATISSSSSGRSVRGSTTSTSMPSFASASAASSAIVHHLRPGDDRDVLALALDVALAERHQCTRRRGPRPYAVERLALDEDDRVVVADRRLQQALRVRRRRRHHHLEPGHVRVEVLERTASAARRAVRRAARAAEHDRQLELPARHLPDLGRVVDDLIERDEREVPGHELDDRPQARPSPRRCRRRRSRTRRSACR